MAEMASPSLMTTRSTPRTPRAFACTFIRRAAPTSASAASDPGQVISRAIDRPGSVSEPWARNAPRHADSQSHRAPDTTWRGRARAGRARAAGPEDQDRGGGAKARGVGGPQPPGRGAGVEFRLDHHPALRQVQAAGEPEQRGDLRLAAARSEEHTSAL